MLREVYGISQYILFSQKFVVRNVIAQTVFRIVSAVTILKTISGLEWDYITSGSDEHLSDSSSCLVFKAQRIRTCL